MDSSAYVVGILKLLVLDDLNRENIVNVLDPRAIPVDMTTVRF